MLTEQISPARPLRVLALAKQIPVFQEMRLGLDGRLVREGVLHMNDYCRRAVAKGHEIAKASGGTMSVMTLGPDSADTVCREALAFAAASGYPMSGIHVSDRAFAGSDTLATARALAAAIRHTGPYDLILCGLNSLDADTGQVPPQIAELLDLPFAAGVRRLELNGETLRLELEHDDERSLAEVALPALLSCAERLCAPCKVKEPEVWAQQDGSLITKLSAADIADGDLAATGETGTGETSLWGQEGSPTSVGEVRIVQTDRERLIVWTGDDDKDKDGDGADDRSKDGNSADGKGADDGDAEGNGADDNSADSSSEDLEAAIQRAVRHCVERGALEAGSAGSDNAGGGNAGAATKNNHAKVPATQQNSAEHDPSLRESLPAIGVIIEPDRLRVARELLGAAAGLASKIGGKVVALGSQLPDAQELGSFGADEGIVFETASVRLSADGKIPQSLANSTEGTEDAPSGSSTGSNSTSASLLEEDIAVTVSCWAEKESVWALLAPSTAWGRQVASRVAAKQEAGLVGDAIGLDVGSSFAASENPLRKHRLVADKPAFGGQLVAEIFCSSPLQMATLRAGVLPLLTPRESEPATISAQPCTPRNRIKLLSRQRDDNSDELANAEVVIGVGQGVDPDDYPLLQDLSNQLGATLSATRKVTDKSWMPRARQVGITGHTISPRLYIAVGLAGNFNHTVGVRTAGTILAINTDPEALIFQTCDIGLVGDWRELLPPLAKELLSQMP